jgi:hypothetical protein
VMIFGSSENGEKEKGVPLLIKVSTEVSHEQLQ